jgi:hypothetical protein
VINLAPPTPLDRFFAHMGWDTYIRFHRDFPLVDFCTTLDATSMTLYVQWTDKRTGEIGSYGEHVSQFPSSVLVASFHLLAGPIGDIKTEYNRVLNRRTRRHLRR